MWRRFSQQGIQGLAEPLAQVVQSYENLKYHENVTAYINPETGSLISLTQLLLTQNIIWTNWDNMMKEGAESKAPPRKSNKLVQQPVQR